MELKQLAATEPWDWPEGAGAAILAVLQDDAADQTDRELAAELAGEMVVINDHLAGILLDLVGNADQPDDLRAIAAIALGPCLEEADTMGFDEPAFDEDELTITEPTFNRIVERLHQLYQDESAPKPVRRRILEAAVRAPRDWHGEAVRAAWAQDDREWRLTAVFCMQFVNGFDDEILAALESDHPEIHYHAVCAAGSWELDPAFRHVAGLAIDEKTEKELRIAAIEAVGTIRPDEAATVLAGLTEHEDEDIADAAMEALVMARGLKEDDFDESDEGDWEDEGEDGDGDGDGRGKPRR